MKELSDLKNVRSLPAQKSVRDLSDLIKIQNQLAVTETKQEILACNDYSERFGLTLTEAEAAELAERRAGSLKAAGRVEFGTGILPKLIFAFCDSPFIEAADYACLLGELQELFYYYKTDSEDAFTDDELIEYMVRVFNGRAQGSLEYLAGTSLDLLCRYARSDYDAFDALDAGDLF